MASVRDGVGVELVPFTTATVTSRFFARDLFLGIVEALDRVSRVKLLD